MTQKEKDILLQEIPKYIQRNCYYRDGSIKCNNLWLVGWAAAEFIKPKNAMKVLINNEYGLLGNLLYKLARHPDEAVTKRIEQEDLQILLKAIDAGGERILFTNELTTDPYAMRLLIRHQRDYKEYVSTELQQSKEFLVSVAEFCPDLIKDTFPKAFDDEAFVSDLIKANYTCLKHFPGSFSRDYQFCLKSVQQEGYALMYFDFELRDSDEIMLAAVSNRGSALSLASERQKKNRDIVYAAVSNCGLALNYADPLLKKDFEIVSLAVKSRGMALKYASPELQDCEEIVKLAVENDGYAICFASERLRDNEVLALNAINTYTKAYDYLSLRLKNKKNIKEQYLLKKEEENKWLPSTRQ